MSTSPPTPPAAPRGTPRATNPRANRGPSAGPENHAALVAAARAVFDEQGMAAPLSAVAKRAGVGQGSLYRHFPDRLSLALAVFDDNMRGIDEIAADPDATLRTLLDHITHLTEGTAAILGALHAPEADARANQIEVRLRAALEAKWEAREGFLGPRATIDDVVLAIGMVAGVVTQAPRNQRHNAATAAWELVQRGLSG